jgi:mRNA interferase MazF
MVTKRYIPEQGDIVWLDLGPKRGHEQGGLRPAVVVSRKQYNAPSGLALFCPITSSVKNYPFEVPIKARKTTGVALVDQVKSFDWQDRKVEYVEIADEETVSGILGALQTLIN